MNMKVIFVSGGSKGLGKGIVENLLRNGYVVATYSRSKTEFINKMEKSKFSNQFYWEALDGTDFEALQRLAQKVFKKYGRIDGLINVTTQVFRRKTEGREEIYRETVIYFRQYGILDCQFPLPNKV